MLLNNCSEHTNLSALIASKKYDDLTEEEKVNMSFSNQKMPEDGKFDEDMPYLDIYISDSLLEVENHLNHTLFSTDPKKMTTDDYLLNHMHR